MFIPFRALIGKICEKHDAPQIFLVVPRKRNSCKHTSAVTCVCSAFSCNYI